MEDVFQVETITEGYPKKIYGEGAPIRVYSDRKYEFKDNNLFFDSLVKNCTYISLFNNDKNITSSNYLRITSSQPLDIFLLMDERIDKGSLRPLWLDDKEWRDIGRTVSTDKELYTTFKVYWKTADTFPVLIGGNKKSFDPRYSSSMFELFVGLKKPNIPNVVEKRVITLNVRKDQPQEDSMKIIKGINRHSAWIDIMDQEKKDPMTEIDKQGRLGTNSNDLGAILEKVEFSLSNANLSHADLSHIHFTPGDSVAFCDFRYGLFIETVLSKSYIASCNFHGAQLNKCNFNDAQLIKCDFSESDLTGTSFRTNKLSECNFSGAIFEPEDLPKIEFMMTCAGLDQLKFRNNPSKGYELAKKFKDAGLKSQYMDVIYSLNVYKTAQTSGFFRALRTIFFEKTCEYGRNPFKLLYIFIIELFAFSLFYTVVIFFNTNANIRRYGKKDRLKFIAKRGLAYSLKATFTNKLMDGLTSSFPDIESGSVKEDMPLLVKRLLIAQSIITFYIIGLFLSIILKNPFENFIL